MVRNKSGRIMDPYLEKNPAAVKAFLAANQPPGPSQLLREQHGDEIADRIIREWLPPEALLLWRYSLQSAARLRGFLNL